MNKVLSTILGASLMSVGLIAVSAPDAFAKPGGGGGKPGGGGGETTTNAVCDVDNIFSDIATYTGCEGAFSGNDSNSLTEVANLFASGASINDGWAKNDAYKIDIDEEYSEGVTTEYYKMFGLSGEDGNQGKVEFLKDVEHEFAIVLKTSTNWSAYMFDGIEAGTVLDWNTLGVSTNNGKGRGLSHLSFYVSDIEVALREEENKPPKVYVPEPSAVLGLAFLGGGMFLSRRRKSS
jgi:hypothetical protein